MHPKMKIQTMRRSIRLVSALSGNVSHNPSTHGSTILCPSAALSTSYSRWCYCSVTNSHPLGNSTVPARLSQRLCFSPDRVNVALSTGIHIQYIFPSKERCHGFTPTPIHTTSCLIVTMVSRVSTIDVFVLVFSLVAFLVVRGYRRRSGLPYPPGPRPLPFIGNLFDIPKESSWLEYTQMSKKYGMNPSPIKLLLT